MSISIIVSSQDPTTVIVPTGPEDFVKNSQTGAFYPVSNPSGFVTGLSLTGFVEKSQTGTLYPASNPDGFITLTAFINTISGYVQKDQTGAFYPVSNPSGFVTDAELSGIEAATGFLKTTSTLNSNALFLQNVAIGGLQQKTGNYLTNAGDILPDSDITYDIGSPSKRFRDLYLSENSIFLGDSKISFSGGPSGGLFVSGSGGNDRLISDRETGKFLTSGGSVTFSEATIENSILLGGSTISFSDGVSGGLFISGSGGSDRLVNDKETGQFLSNGGSGNFSQAFVQSSLDIGRNIFLGDESNESKIQMKGVGPVKYEFTAGANGFKFTDEDYDIDLINIPHPFINSDGSRNVITLDSTKVQGNFLATGGMYHSDSITGPQYGFGGGSDLYLKTSGLTRMAVRQNGDVGIGTAFPDAKLHVIGDTILSGLVTLSGGTDLKASLTAVGSLSATNDIRIRDITGSNGLIDTAISNLVNSAPETLDTLNELAAALGDDPNFATTITSGLSSKVNKSETGVLYPISNPSGFITGVDLSNYVQSSETGVLYPISNPSGFITGVDLSNYIGDVKLGDFTSTARISGASALNPVQNFQPATDDTVCNLCVDTAGNVVRGSQEATWTFSRDQLNALTTAKVNLLSSPGAGKCIVVEESNWLIEVDLTKAAQSTPVSLACEIVNGQTQYKVATQITAANLTLIAGHIKTANTDAFGMYSRDVPELDRISKFNEPMTIRAKNSSGVVNFPDNFVSVRLKIKYRVFDKDTF